MQAVWSTVLFCYETENLNSKKELIKSYLGVKEYKEKLGVMSSISIQFIPRRNRGINWHK